MLERSLTSQITPLTSNPSIPHPYPQNQRNTLTPTYAMIYYLATYPLSTTPSNHPFNTLLKTPGKSLISLTTT